MSLWNYEHISDIFRKIPLSTNNHVSNQIENKSVVMNDTIRDIKDNIEVLISNYYKNKIEFKKKVIHEKGLKDLKEMRDMKNRLGRRRSLNDDEAKILISNKEELVKKKKDEDLSPTMLMAKRKKEEEKLMKLIKLDPFNSLGAMFMPKIHKSGARMSAEKYIPLLEKENRKGHDIVKTELIDEVKTRVDEIVKDRLLTREMKKLIKDKKEIPLRMLKKLDKKQNKLFNSLNNSREEIKFRDFTHGQEAFIPGVTNRKKYFSSTPSLNTSVIASPNYTSQNFFSKTVNVFKGVSKIKFVDETEKQENKLQLHHGKYSRKSNKDKIHEVEVEEKPKQQEVTNETNYKHKEKKFKGQLLSINKIIGASKEATKVNTEKQSPSKEKGIPKKKNEEVIVLSNPSKLNLELIKKKEKKKKSSILKEPDQVKELLIQARLNARKAGNNSSRYEDGMKYFKNISRSLIRYERGLNHLEMNKSKDKEVENELRELEDFHIKKKQSINPFGKTSSKILSPLNKSKVEDKNQNSIKQEQSLQKKNLRLNQDIFGFTSTSSFNTNNVLNHLQYKKATTVKNSPKQMPIRILKNFESYPKTKTKHSIDAQDTHNFNTICIDQITKKQLFQSSSNILESQSSNLGSAYNINISSINPNTSKLNELNSTAQKAISNQYKLHSEKIINNCCDFVEKKVKSISSVINFEKEYGEKLVKRKKRDIKMDNNPEIKTLYEPLPKNKICFINSKNINSGKYQSLFSTSDNRYVNKFNYDDILGYNASMRILKDLEEEKFHVDLDNYEKKYVLKSNKIKVFSTYQKMLNMEENLKWENRVVDDMNLKAKRCIVLANKTVKRNNSVT